MEQRAFNPNTDMPITKDEALEILRRWGLGFSMSYQRDRAARCYKLLSGAIPEFKREERYVVIKLKDLSAAQYKLVQDAVNNGIPTRSAVVVEKDWPEYEKVWDMLTQRTMSGG